MTFLLGMAAGSVLSFVIWVAYFGPKHWDWYQQNKAQAATIIRLAQERDHYKAVSTPSKWGPVEQHEARIVTKQRPYPEVDAGPIEHRFDDILEGEPNAEV